MIGLPGNFEGSCTGSTPLQLGDMGGNYLRCKEAGGFPTQCGMLADRESYY